MHDDLSSGEEAATIKFDGALNIQKLKSKVHEAAHSRKTSDADQRLGRSRLYRLYIDSFS